MSRGYLIGLVRAGILLGCLLCASVARAQSAPAPLPLEAFFRHAELNQASLSPSGRWLSFLSRAEGGRIDFTFIDLEGKVGNYAVTTGSADDVVWYRWVNEDWLVFSVRDPNYQGADALGSGLMAMSRDGKTSRMLVARQWKRGDVISQRRLLEPNHRFVDLGAPGSNEIVVAETEYDVRGEPSHSTLKVLDVATAAVRLADPDAPKAQSWWLDRRGRPRVAVRHEEGRLHTLWSDPQDGRWREIGNAPIFRQTFAPLFLQDERTLLVRAVDARGDLEVRRMELGGDKPVSTTLFATPGFDDQVRVIVDPLSRTLAGLGFYVQEEAAVWLSPAMKSIQEKVDAKLPGRVNRLTCRPCDRPQVVLVHSASDRDPGALLLYRPQDERWQLVGRQRPDLPEERMAALALHRTRARDGADLPVWVSIPPGAAAKAPAVVLVHGGPWLRGQRWAWDAETQFLASRGYVVVAPEFRGSEGYGAGHFQAGLRQWGQKMQDDVTDALRFAVDKGWVDPARVCIMGASYGGYSALMGLVRDPGLYRCAVAGAAVADPRFMFDFHWSDLSTTARQYSLPTLVGDRQKDEAMFVANSPLEQVARISSPVLLWHGGADRRVPIQNARRMRDALQKAGKSLTWVEYPSEGHSLRDPVNEFDLYRRIEAFLAEHLKP